MYKYILKESCSKAKKKKCFLTVIALTACCFLLLTIDDFDSEYHYIIHHPRPDS